MSATTTTFTSNPEWNATTTAEEVATALSSIISDKTILVTGVLPGGLGAHFVTVVLEHHPKLLILADRSGPKFAEHVATLQAAHPDVAIRALEIDLSSQAEIRKAAAEVLSWSEPIDVLVNNAGVMATSYRKTAEGIELDFGINYVGHFLFTNLIMPKLLESKSGPRVVNVASTGHHFTDIRWNDINFEVRGVCFSCSSPEPLTRSVVSRMAKCTTCGSRMASLRQPSCSSLSGSPRGWDPRVSRRSLSTRVPYGPISPGTLLTKTGAGLAQVSTCVAFMSTGTLTLL